MKKIIALLLCVSLFAALAPAGAYAAPEAASAAGDLNIAVLSDLRYFPDTLAGDKGEAYYAYTGGAGVIGRDQDALLDAAFASLRAQAEKNRLDCVVICGDLTLGGEYAGAEALARKLSLFAFETGLRVCVLNGDRDINNPGASEFSTNLKKPTRGVTQAEFAELFASLGYRDAFHVYKPLGSGTQGALTYSMRLEQGYRLILADCCRYTADCTDSHTDACERGSAFSEAQLAWVLEEAADAKRNGETPLLFTHAGLVPMNDFEEYLLPDALIADAYRIRDSVAAAGVLCSFSGGVNAADTNVYWSDSGLPLYAVSAPSVTQFPFAYRITRFDAGNDGSVDLYFEQHDCDETAAVRATGGNLYPTPYRSVGFAKQFGGNADAAAYLNILARAKLDELCADIIQTGGVVAYIEKLFSVDVRSAVVSAVGNGLRLGPVTVLSAANVLSYIEDLDARLMEHYVRRPSNLYGAVENAVRGFTEIKVSDVPCSRWLTEYGFGSTENGGTLGELILDLLATVKPGDESVSGDAFLCDALITCADPAFAKTLTDAFRTYVVDGILVNEILANTEFRMDTLFADGILSDATHLQVFLSVMLAVAASRLLQAQTDGQAWEALSALLTDDSDLSVASVLDVLLNAGGSASGRTVDEVLDTVFGLLCGEEQLAAIADQIGAYLNSLCYDDTADTGRRYDSRSAAAPDADEKNMRVPAMVQIGVNSSTSFTVTWFTKYSVTGTDIELIKESGAFTGQPTVNSLIASDTARSDYRGFGFDCGNYGFMPYVKDVVRHVITVRNLVAGTRFRFRIGDAEKGLWKECAFETGSADGSFTFLNLCDSDAVTAGGYQTVFSALRLAADELQPSFIVHSGNLVRNPGSDAQWARALDGAADVFSRAPLMYASGSNDANGDYAVQKHLTYSRTPMQYEENGVYYSFDYGCAHFAVLNTNSLLADGSLSARQEEWLKNDLGNSQADWKILVCYAPVFCVENGNYQLEAQLKTIGKKYQVDLVLEGGVGAYLRSHLLKDGAPTDALVETVKRGGRNIPVFLENACMLVTSSGMFGGDTKEQDIRHSLAAVEQRLATPVFSAVTVEGDTLLVSAYTVTEGRLERIDAYGLRKDSVTFLQGDADMDGTVTPADARLALRIAVGLDIVTPITKAAADFDGDIRVSPADARLILRASVGLEKEPRQMRVYLYDMAKYKNA